MVSDILVVWIRPLPDLSPRRRFRKRWQSNVWFSSRHQFWTFPFFVLPSWVCCFVATQFPARPTPFSCAVRSKAVGSEARWIDSQGSLLKRLLVRNCNLSGLRFEMEISHLDHLESKGHQGVWGLDVPTSMYWFSMIGSCLQVSKSKVGSVAIGHCSGATQDLCGAV